MSRRRRVRQVEIFNFSFLDVLACTIGLLVFIMVMVFILQSGSAVVDVSDLIRQKLAKASKLQSQATRDEQISAGLESQFDQIHPPSGPDLTPQRNAALAERDRSKTKFDEAMRQIGALQTRIDDARLARDQSTAANLASARADLAAAQARRDQAAAELADLTAKSQTHSVTLKAVRRPGNDQESFDILHIDCHADQVVVLRIDDHQQVTEIGRTAVDQLRDPQSDFQKAVAAQLVQAHPLILFWVRPDGADVFEAAKSSLPDSTACGFEPADADWKFDTVAP